MRCRGRARAGAARHEPRGGVAVARQPPLDRVLPPQRRGEYGTGMWTIAPAPVWQPFNVHFQDGRVVRTSTHLYSADGLFGVRLLGGAAARDLSAVAAGPWRARRIRQLLEQVCHQRRQVRAPHRSCARLPHRRRARNRPAVVMRHARPRALGGEAPSSIWASSHSGFPPRAGGSHLLFKSTSFSSIRLPMRECRRRASFQAPVLRADRMRFRVPWFRGSARLGRVGRQHHHLDVDEQVAPGVLPGMPPRTRSWRPTWLPRGSVP